MYAIIEEGGKQYKVAEGDVVRVEKVDHEPGETFAMGKVLLLSQGDKVLVGTPLLDNVTVSAEVKSQGRGAKVISRKFRRRVADGIGESRPRGAESHACTCAIVPGRDHLSVLSRGAVPGGPGGRPERGQLPGVVVGEGNE